MLMVLAIRKIPMNILINTCMLSFCKLQHFHTHCKFFQQKGFDLINTKVFPLKILSHTVRQKYNEITGI